MWRDRKKKYVYVLTIFLDSILMLYCILCIQELKWKLLLLPQGGFLLSNIMEKWLEGDGKSKPASVLRKINRLLSIVWLMVLLVTLLGSLLGIWNL